MDLDSLYDGWTRQAAAAWAKLDNDDVANGATLSVPAHLADTAHVASWMWENFLATSIKRRLADALGTLEAAKICAVFVAGVHDVGKLSPSFASKADLAGFPEARASMQRAGLTFPIASSSDVHHSTAGHMAVQHWLGERHGYRRRHSASIACIVGGHHGVYPSSITLTAARGRPSALGLAPVSSEDVSNCPWHIARTEILDRVAEATGFDQLARDWASTGWPIEVQMLLTGFVILCDWIASDASLFPYGEARPGRLSAALRSFNLPGTWNAVLPAGAKQLFQKRYPNLKGLSPSPLQVAALNAAAECAEPTLMIIEAPMGSGKTEAGQMASEAMAARVDAGGAFWGLPTMATANPMFDRTLQWLDNTLDSDASVMLAHSKAHLHDGFNGLIRDSNPRGIYDESTNARSKAVVASWFTGRKKSTQASFVVGTVDQLLLMALRAKHVSLRHLAMAAKVVVVDECHAADDYMRVYLKRALTWLARLGAPVILMSATLPPSQRQELADAYRDGLGLPAQPLLENSAYPRLTLVGHQNQVLAVEPDDRVWNVQVSTIDDDVERLVEELRDALQDGGCAAVIRNTVDRAQVAYDALKAHFGQDTILLHSRFVAPHRTMRERDLVRCLGRQGDRPKRLVVVGTQVLEQSLDIDVDIMVSDLAPMDLLLQRVGRLHRHHRAERPTKVSTPRLLLTGADFSAPVPEPTSGSIAVYGAAKLLRSASMILREGGETLRLPQDIPVLVNEAYHPDLKPPSGWESVWAEAEAAQKARIADQGNKASEYLLLNPLETKTLLDANDASASDPESPRAQGKRQVRDAEETIEVILLRRDNNGHLRLLPQAGLDDIQIPETPHVDIPLDVARVMASATISLPLRLMRRFDAVEQSLNSSLDYSNWDRSPWLSGQLALVLDESGSATVAGFQLTYSYEKGLEYTLESTEA